MIKLASTPSRLLIVAIIGLSLTACAEQESEDTVVSDGAFNTSLSVAEVMLSVLEPASDTLWDNAGWVESAAGYEELYPTTDEGWAFVRAQAAVVAESGNLLALPGRAEDDDAWMIYSDGIVNAGLMAMRAAEERNEEDFFQAGAQLYSVCTACHQAYNPDILNRFDDEED
jgi:hypothetical protein